jgi:glucosamine--fructose-6-phosphate aminotransferase (isomerizing)
MSLITEINEQPERLKSLLFSQRKTAEQIARAIRKYDIGFAFLAARGTSDNAGRYANYLWGALNRLPIALATPSLFTYYQKPPRLKNALVVGISQSGKSPDILSVLEEGKRQNCLTLAITNESDSPLARISDFVMDIQAGPELAVAATKTYTAELMAIAMLSVAMSEDKSQWKVLGKVGRWAREILKQNNLIEQAAQRYRYMRQCVVLGRGYNYSTAYEWALKLKELTYVVAEPYSSADFQHGPIAMIETSFPVMAINPDGSVFETMKQALAHLRNDFGAELVIISNNKEALELAQTPLSIPKEIPEWVTPLVSIIPAQLFAYHLTLAKGFDTERPRSIRKVTETR